MTKREDLKYLLTMFGGMLAISMIIAKMCNANYDLGKRS